MGFGEGDGTGAGSGRGTGEKKEGKEGRVGAKGQEVMGWEGRDEQEGG